MRRAPLAAVLVAACAREPAGTAGDGPGAPEPPPEPAMSNGITIEPKRVEVGGASLAYLEAGPAESALPPVLLLHGQAFRATTWRELGTLEHLASEGIRAIALDLPGHGDSEAAELERTSVVALVVDALGLAPPVVVSPSMSGRFAVPFVTAEPARAAGWVPVAPVIAAEDRASLAGAGVPTLAFWGSADRHFPLADGRALVDGLAEAELVVVEGGSHPCYLDAPELFHERLAGFVRGLAER